MAKQNKDRRPLWVYLDSSDFSVLSDPSRATPRHQLLLQELEQRASNRDVVFCFSSIHVEEAAPLAPDHVPQARRRFELMHRLCGKRSLKHSSVMLFDEIRVASGRMSDQVSRVRRDDGCWHPPLNMDFPSLDELFREQLDAASPSDRLLMEQIFLDRRGKLKREVRSEMARRVLPEFLPRMASNYPTTPTLIAAFRRYLLYDGARSAVPTALSESLTDLRLLGELYLKQWDATSKLATSLRTSGERMKATLSGMAAQLAEVAKDSTRIPLARERDQILEQLIEDMPKGIASRLTSEIDESITPEQMSFSWERTPSIKTMARLAGQVARATAWIPNPTRLARTSDMGDIAHALYLPHVDIFRADGFFSDAIRAARLPFNTTVVSKLIDLPDAIQIRLQSV